MPRLLLVLVVLAFYALHQDVWFWRSIHPIAFGVLPVGLFYHAAYTLAISGLAWMLVRYAWPGHLDEDSDGRGDGRNGGRNGGRDAKVRPGAAASSSGASPSATASRGARR